MDRGIPGKTMDLRPSGHATIQPYADLDSEERARRTAMCSRAAPGADRQVTYLRESHSLAGVVRPDASPAASGPVRNSPRVRPSTVRPTSVRATVRSFVIFMSRPERVTLTCLNSAGRPQVNTTPPMRSAISGANRSSSIVPMTISNARFTTRLDSRRPGCRSGITGIPHMSSWQLAGTAGASSSIRGNTHTSAVICPPARSTDTTSASLSSGDVTIIR